MRLYCERCERHCGCGLGACWAFSATGAIEGINKIVTGSLVSLSEQELIDCDTSYNTGCNGGLMDYTFQFVIDNHGIDTEQDYPFQARDKSCDKDKVSSNVSLSFVFHIYSSARNKFNLIFSKHLLQLKRHVVTIDGYTDVASNNERQLLQAVATQPVSVGICGSERAFQLYSKVCSKAPSQDHYL